MKIYIGLVVILASVFLSGMELDQKTLDQNLIIAAKNGNKQECRLLIENGADVNATNIEGMTPLTMAATKGNKDICKLLIAKGADVNAVDNYSMTALIVAAYAGHKEVCELLIAKHAYVNAIDNQGNTALMMAATILCQEICEFLMANGAEVNITYKNSRTILTNAALSGAQGICELVLINSILRGSLRVTLREAQDRIFTALLVLEQKIKMGHLPQDLLLVVISELKDDLFTLVAGRQGNMDKFPPILQGVVADCIISFLLSEEGKKFLEETQKKADRHVKDLFTIEGVLKIFPGELGNIVRKKMIDSKLIKDVIK